MALTLIATPGLSTSNTYVTLAGAETIMEGYYPKAAWSAATDANKNAALVSATRRIDTLPLLGTKYYSEYREGETGWQALHFPTVWDIDEDDVLFIPEAVERACALEASYLLRTGTASQATADLIASGITSFRTGKHSEEIGGSGGIGTVSSEAYNLLIAYGHIMHGVVKIRRG